MTAGRWKRVQEVFAAALTKSSDERSPFLEGACTGDPELRAEVESLLAYDERAADFLRPPTIEACDAVAQLPTTRDDSDDRIGRRVGPWRLVRLLGAGGMGTVYLAERADGQFEKTVAIKLIRRGMATGDAHRRFRNERQALANLEHPSIARLLDGGVTDDELPYLVMEHVEGTPIDRHCDERRLGVRERLQLFRAVCAAVHHAHRHLIVHRDLKPSNVLVTQSGEPKLLDFGIAKFLDPDVEAPRTTADVTATEHRLLTPRYASPEQVRGEPITTATDVYSLGVILYELLTGHRPYQVTTRRRDEFERVICEETPTRPSAAVGRTLEVTPQGVHAPIVITPESVSATREGDPRRLKKLLEGDLDTIVLMALRKEPARRYASVEQLSEDVRRHLESLPVLARPDSFPYRASTFVRRNRAGVVATLVVFIALVAGLATSTALYVNATRAKRVADVERQAAVRREYLANVAAADAAMRAADVAEARRRLDRAAPDLRNWEWRYLAGRLDQSARTFVGHESRVLRVAWSRDGALIASGSGDSSGKDESVRLWDARTGRLRQTLRGHTAAILGLALTPDGRTVASASVDKTVRLWDATTGAPLHVLTGHTGPIYALAMSSDGTVLASASDDPNDGIRLWNPRSEESMADLRGGNEQEGVLSLAISPDGTTLVSATTKGTVTSWDLAKRAPASTLRAHSMPINAVAFSPDGERIVTASDDRTLAVWRASDAVLLAKLQGHAGNVATAAFSPDGRWIASSGGDRSVRLWDAATGREVTRWEGHTDWVDSLAFSPDGSEIVTASNDLTLKVWSVDLENDSRRLEGHEHLVRALAFSPDGSRLATAAFDHTARLWDVSTGRAIATLTHPFQTLQSVAFSPDGSRLAVAGGDTTVRVWDTRASTVTAMLAGHDASVNAVAFSPDGATIASGSLDATVRLWDVATGATRAVLRGHTAWLWSLAYDSKGTMLATASRDGTVRLWDPKRGAPLAVLVHGSEVNGIAISPKGRLLASAGSDRTIVIWDLSTHERIRTLVGHSGVVYAVAFSPDGTRLVSASEDTTVRLWDPATGDEVLSLRGPTDWIHCVFAVGWSPDGTTIAAGGGNYRDRGNIVTLWQARPAN